MCGICGTVSLRPGPPVDPQLIERMVREIRHRGPDGSGTYTDAHAALGHARLSILDLTGGGQPIANEDETIWIVFNGEVFNYVELRQDLESRGHLFRTRSDTEVVVHAFEEYGADCVDRFIGDFSFALWDVKERRLFCARDRAGVRPFFYTVANGTLLFASEIKSLLCDPRIPGRLSPVSLLQTFVFWAPLSPRTAFEGISELPPGHTLEVVDGGVRVRRYWDFRFDATAEAPDRSEESYADELRHLLADAVKLRLRADVPVGSYLSGGLDSSIVTALMRHVGHDNMKTFSIVFDDPAYDESAHQLRLSAFLGTQHEQFVCRRTDIARAFPRALWHCETPVLRTATAPMLLLSGLVRECGIKVVLTGEGADEVLAGYDIFKEAKIRRFWAKQPESKSRPLLLQRLYPYFAMPLGQSQTYLEAFFGEGLTHVDDPLYSHLPRFRTTARNLLFLSPDVLACSSDSDEVAGLREHVRAKVAGLDPLSAAQYIEATTLLPCYILNSQGDRPMMANAVEGRVPYLDHRVIELAARIPPTLRLRGLDEKHILRRATADLLPPATQDRKKQPYMAPEARCFLGNDAPEYVADLLSAERLREDGYFDPKAVSGLVEKCRRRDVVGFRDNMAFVGVLSTQIIHALFVRGETISP